MPASEPAVADLTAVLLCGGKGERLRPFTETLPKPLVPLNGKPLLHHLMLYLASSGVTRFVACVGYKADAIRDFLRDTAPLDWQVDVVDSGEASMTDRLIDARTHVPGRSLVCYGDTLANVNIGDLLRYHLRVGTSATVTIHPLNSPFGIVDVDDQGLVRAFTEKPLLPYWINIGFLMCERGVFEGLQRGSDMVAFLSSLARGRTLGAYRHTGRHLTVNTEKDRVDAEAAVVQFYTYPDGS